MLLLKVSGAAYYARRRAESSSRARPHKELTEAIVAIHDEPEGTYGTPRVRAELRNRGHRHSASASPGSCAPPAARDERRRGGAPPPSPTRPRAPRQI
ncbi:IS3 family transposase [Amycolatopsis sp. NPDC059090]|uniref:IS3 family transposase n=1 Tax=Amycolatopsis sp. NPDC059090 TaxID=3346723 RepID=UPI0036708475